MAFDVMGAKQAGYTDQEIQAYLASKGQVTSQPQTQPQESGGLGKTLLPLGGSILGGLLGIPLGVPGIIGGGAAGGAAGGALAGGNLTDILKEALLGGVGGIFPASRIGKVAGAGARVAEEVGAQTAERAAGGVGGKIAGLGQTMRRSVVNPKVSPRDIMGATKEVQMTEDVNRIVPGFSAIGKRQNMAKVAQNLFDQKSQLLENSTATLPGESLKNLLRTSVTQRTGIDLTKGANKKTFDILTANLKGDVSEKSLDEIEVRASQLAKRTFEQGYQPSERPDIARGIYDSIDDIIIDQNPALKAIKGQISILKQTIPGLSTKAKEIARFPFTGIPIPGGARAIQAGTDLLGRGLEAGGNAVGRIPIPAGLAPNIVGQVGTRALTGNMPEAQAAESTIPQPKTSTTRTPPDLTELLKRAALVDMQQNNGKNLTKIIALSEFLNPPMSASTKTQMQQIEGAQSLVDQLENVYTQASQAGELGAFGRGSLSTLTGKITGGAVAGSANLYDNLRRGFTALIARSTGERGVLTDADAARAMALIPSANTTPEFAARQFEEIRKIFSDAQARIGGQGQWSIPMPTNQGL